MNKQKKFLFIICLFVIILSACSSPEKNIYEIIEQTAKKEAELEKQQQTINDLELKEKALYDKIMEFGMKETDEVNRLSEEAVNNLDKRQELIDKENRVFKQTENDFKKVSDEIDKISDSNLKEQAITLQSMMEERFKAYYDLNDAYMQALSEDRKIYELFQTDDAKVEELHEQISTSNQVYEQVTEASEKFNQITEEFNSAKLKFYKDAGIPVQK